MSLRINPICSYSSDPDDQLFCSDCDSDRIIDGRFRITAQLGKGGFATVYEVLSEYGKTQVLKVLHRNEPKAIELFQREAYALSQCTHPGIPQVDPESYFTFIPHANADPLHCLVMERVRGLNLRGYVAQRGRAIEQRIVLRWIKKPAHILKEIHSQGFLHRDIKPSNIMLKPDGKLVLLDFGSAKPSVSASSADTKIGCGLYTPAEQLHGMAVPQSDFFALGRTAIFLLTAQNLNELYDTEINELKWQEKIPDLQPELGDFLQRLTAYAPSKRPSNEDTLVQEIDKLESTMRRKESKLLFSKEFLEDVISTQEESSHLQHEFQSERDNSKTTQPSIRREPVQERTALPSVFMERCQQRLAELIGPIASVIFRQIIEDETDISEEELVDTLCQQLSEPQDAARFRKVMLSADEAPS
jgi:eukaryotic-like serine/threonine-protein kinase